MRHQTGVPRIDWRGSMCHRRRSCVHLASVRGCSRSSQLWTRWRSRVGSIRSSCASATNPGSTPKRGIHSAAAASLLACGRVHSASAGSSVTRDLGYVLRADGLPERESLPRRIPRVEVHRRPSRASIVRGATACSSMLRILVPEPGRYSPRSQRMRLRSHWSACISRLATPHCRVHGSQEARWELRHGGRRSSRQLAGSACACTTSITVSFPPRGSKRPARSGRILRRSGSRCTPTAHSSPRSG